LFNSFKIAKGMPDTYEAASSAATKELFHLLSARAALSRGKRDKQ